MIIPYSSTNSIKSYLLSLLLLSNFHRTKASSSTADTVSKNNPPINMPRKSHAIRIVFSDVDGTLVHYPESSTIDDAHHKLVRLPPSATGMQGILSSDTLAQCQAIRDRGVKLVLVSGMRTSTLLKRLPFLPQADAYCSEAGGRIFYRRDTTTINNDAQKSFTVTLQDGAAKPFQIVEDLEWRRRMQDPRAAGKDGYPGAELNENHLQAVVPIENRVGALWDFARQLLEKGYVLDTQGYASCFRVNRKQQTKVSPEEFDKLLRGKGLPCPPELGTSVNLGCIDYYPVESGKKNCCQYLASKFLVDTPSSSPTELLSTHCVCLCDDDNDLEMAMTCQHAFIPGISSESMANIIANNPDHFSQTGGTHHEGIEGTIATEKALSLVLDRIIGR